jgi:hypothetical protein
MSHNHIDKHQIEERAVKAFGFKIRVSVVSSPSQRELVGWGEKQWEGSLYSAAHSTGWVKDAVTL